MTEDSLTDYELVHAVEGLTPRDDQEYVEGLLLRICTRIGRRVELPDDEISGKYRNWVHVLLELWRKT